MKPAAAVYIALGIVVGVLVGYFVSAAGYGASGLSFNVWLTYRPLTPAAWAAAGAICGLLLYTIRR